MSHSKVIVEVAMEIAHMPVFLEKVHKRYGAAVTRACAMSNSVGGIGPLLKERIPALGELGADVVGVSLLYDNVWIQGFYQWGQIYIEKKNVGGYLRGLLEDTGIQFALEMEDGTSADVKVWKAPYGKASVYFLDAPEISSVVYPGPEDAPEGTPNIHEWAEIQKLKQSWLVGRGALKLVKILGKKPDVIVQSEAPTFFANHFLVTDEFQKDPFFEGAKYVFNDHTPLEYAHPVWGEAQLRRSRIDPKYTQDPVYLNRQNRTVDVTRLLIGVSDAVYGVAKKHGRVMRAMPSLNDFADKIQSITNGISVPDWQSPDFKDAKDLSDADLIALKDRKKSEMIDWVWRTYHLWVDWRDKVKGKCVVLWTRRVTSYKRFDVIERLLKDPALRERFLKTEIIVMIGGRIHQNDDLSQNVMFRLLDIVTRDPILKDRVLVLDNYNIWAAPKLFSGVDGTIMLADDGREASATGFMKAQANGAAVIASPDGAVPESVTFQKEGSADAFNGFEVPYVNGQPQPEGLMRAFEQLDAAYHNAGARAKMIRAALDVEPQISVDRTAKEMMELFASLK